MLFIVLVLFGLAPWRHCESPRVASLLPIGQRRRASHAVYSPLLPAGVVLIAGVFRI